VSADQKRDKGPDVVALIAGVLFLLIGVTSLTVGSLDLPDIGAAPLWVILIVVGVLLLVNEFRGRKNQPRDTASSTASSEQSAWDQDPYR